MLDRQKYSIIAASPKALRMKARGNLFGKAGFR